VLQTTLTAYIAAALIIVAFFLYNKEEGKINTGTWVILAIGDSFDLGSYYGMTEGEWLKNIVPFCFAIGSIITFGVAVLKRRFSCPDKVDVRIILIDLLIMVLWVMAEEVTSTTANLAYQVTTLIAFWPMYRGLMSGREEERAAPWALWSLAYLLFLANSLSFEGSWTEVAYPVVGLITHAVVWGLAFRKQSKQGTPPAS
jgi:hypothetical protein